jgi:hypothetical protein
MAIMLTSGGVGQVVLSYQAKQGLGLSYNQKLGYGAVGGCGSILHPSFSLVLGLVLRERIKSKK